MAQGREDVIHARITKGYGGPVFKAQGPSKVGSTYFYEMSDTNINQRLVSLASTSKPHTDTNDFANSADKSANYNKIESYLRPYYAEEAKQVTSCFDDTELELPKSDEDCTTNSKLYGNAANSISTYLRELNRKRLFGDKTQKHRLEICQKEWPAKRARQSSGSLTESPSDMTLTSQCHLDHDPRLDGSQNSPHVTERTIDAESNVDHEARGVSTDESIPESGLPEGAGSQLETGSDASLIVIPAVKVTAGGYETQPSTDTTASVGIMEVGMEPDHLHSSPGCRNTRTYHPDHSYLDRPRTDIVEVLHDYGNNSSQFSSLGLGQTSSTQLTLGSSLSSWPQIIDIDNTGQRVDETLPQSSRNEPDFSLNIDLFNFGTESFIPLETFVFSDCQDEGGAQE